MDYVFELDGAEPAQFSLPDGTALAEFVLGYELELRTVVYMQVLLVKGESYLHDEIGDVYDLQFGIREKLADDDNIRTCIDYSYISTKRFIPEEQRARIFNLIDHCLEQIILSSRPVHITMETYHSNVPAKAMAKYDRIADHIQALGYGLTERFRGTDNGVDYWYFWSDASNRSARVVHLVERLSRYLRRGIHFVLERLP